MEHSVLRLESPFLFQPFFMYEPPGSPRYRWYVVINVARVVLLHLLDFGQVRNRYYEKSFSSSPDNATEPTFKIFK